MKKQVEKLQKMGWDLTLYFTPEGVDIRVFKPETTSSVVSGAKTLDDVPTALNEVLQTISVMYA